MSGIDTRHLFDLFVTADAGQVRVGDAPYGRRRIVAITGDRFEGDRLRGRILPGGADWILERSDGVLEMDVRMTLETDDGAFVYVTFRGFRHGPREVLDRIVRGESVDPGAYYQRAALFFETGAGGYLWLNRIVGVAKAERHPDHILYRVFEVL